MGQMLWLERVGTVSWVSDNHGSDDGSAWSTCLSD